MMLSANHNVDIPPWHIRRYAFIMRPRHVYDAFLTPYIYNMESRQDVAQSNPIWNKAGGRNGG